MTYGYNGGTVPFTGWTPILGTGDAATPSTSGAVQNNGLTDNDGHIARLFFPNGQKATKTLLYALLGAAVGGSAVASYKRVLGVQALNDPSQLGGLVTIETASLINRSTNSTDLTNMQALFTRTPAPPSYPADVSGNGGGGKAGW